MSQHIATRRKTAPDIAAMKGVQPIASLTAYTAPMAKIVDRHCDFILVGDSLGMTVYGLPSTVGVTMEMMIAHGRAVVAHSAQSLIVVDMPFGAYEASPEQAFRNAARIMTETGCGAVKLEGGAHMAETVAFLTARGIPVLAHIGLTPQSVNALGGYKVQGRGSAADDMMADARALNDAGAFGVVIEKSTESVARTITDAIAGVTIGIGASPACDGQILVVDDILGIFPDFRPKFAKVYAELGLAADKAVEAYANEVRAKTFPEAKHTFRD
jgi:3-methyl-2-oxobutanoate hydroxymethyltransferase